VERPPVSLRLHGDTLARPGELDFAVNVWPGVRPPALDRALAAALEGRSYPDESKARMAVAARHGRDSAEVLVANGACEVFWLLAHVLRPARAACIHPSFTEPEAALRAVGAEVAHVLREPARWSFDPAEVPDEAELVVLGNPNNPTGALDPAERILELLRPGRIVVVDESFMDFVPGERESLATATAPGLLVVRSLTKLWSLPGIRAGYALGEATLVEALSAQRQPWSVNAVACAALTWCAADPETPRRVGAEVAVARERLAAGLTGARVWPSAANFLLLRVADGPAIVASLRERGIAVRPCGSFPGLGDDYLRVAVRGEPDDSVLASALAGLL
jgi:histidinol-phosphate/aromatic aminotransferase/cobyric acid decarboxylase-like protein